MPFLIDRHNVIAALPDIALEDPDDEARPVVKLRAWSGREAAQRYFIGSAGQQRVPADFLEALHIPLPPLDIQRAIVQQVEAGRTEVARLREQAAQRALAARAEVEAALLGKLC